MSAISPYPIPLNAPRRAQLFRFKALRPFVASIRQEGVAGSMATFGFTSSAAEWRKEHLVALRNRDTSARI
jgi:hypothetical protein